MKVKEKADKDKTNFEEILGRLEEIVGKLGQGDLSLNQSLNLFEEGVTLSKEGHRILDEAESKIEVLLASGESAPYGAVDKERDKKPPDDPRE